MASSQNASAAARGAQNSPNMTLIAGIAAVVVVVLIVMVFAVRHTVATAKANAAAYAASDPSENFMIQMSKKCGGDFNKLSPADQYQVIKVAGGGGPSE